MANAEGVLLETLDDLESEQLNLFTWLLKNGVEGFHQIPRGLLKKAGREEIVDKMVEKYGISGAVEITLIILKKIDRNQLAQELKSKLGKGGVGSEEVTDERAAASSSTQRAPPADASKAAFIDDKWVELVRRATAMEAILDELLSKKVINNGQYSELCSERTQEMKMRRLHNEALRACGDSGKAILYDVLMVEQPFMMKDLGAS